MLDSVMFWNEPNNQSHWDYHIDHDWVQFSAMVRQAGAMVKETNPAITRVMGGISPIDPEFIRKLEEHRALEAVDVVAVHGFPLDWNHWQYPDYPDEDPNTITRGIHAWPRKIKLINDVSHLPVWATEVGVSAFGAEEEQAWGLRKTSEYLSDVERVYWYSLFDLPFDRPATTRHKESEGSSYYRHFHMGLLRSDGEPKLAAREWAQIGTKMGVVQWFHHLDEKRLLDSVRWLRELGVTDLRTGISWADSHIPGAWEWFDYVMETLKPFRVLATLCFTPPSRGQRPDHTSPPLDIGEYAWFCGEVIRRYAPASVVSSSEGVLLGG